MADQKVSELASASTVGQTDLLYLVQGSISKRVAFSALCSSISTHVWVSAPATSTSAGVLGQAAFDTSSLYICVAANTWKKIALSSW